VRYSDRLLNIDLIQWLVVTYWCVIQWLVVTYWCDTVIGCYILMWYSDWLLHIFVSQWLFVTYWCVIQWLVVTYWCDTVIGCSDIAVTPQTWVRYAADRDTAEIGCVHASQSWQLICRDQEWTGYAENCSTAGKVSRLMYFFNIHSWKMLATQCIS